MSMIKLEKSIAVNASPETAFDFITNPVKMSSALTGIFEASLIPELPLQTGSHFNFKYHLGDSIINGVWKVKTLNPPSLYIAETRGLSTSTWTHEIVASGEGSLIKLTFEYHLPTGLLNQYQEKQIVSLNEENMERIAAALKTSMEKH